MTFTNRTALLRAIMLGASALTVTAIAASPAMAQTTTSTIKGRVTDSAGAPAANVAVSATNLATGQTVTTTSDAGGNYPLSGLRPADYSIRATAGGTARYQG